MTVLRWPVAAVGIGLALATRLPGPMLGSAIAIAVATLLASALVWGAVKPEARGPRAATLILAVSLLAVPGPRAPLIEAPAAAVALALLVLLHLVIRPTQGQPPKIGPGLGSVHRLLRFVPVLALLALAIALPWLARATLPDRISAIAEWHSPMGILTVGAVLVLLLTAAGSLRALLGRRTVPP